MENTENPNAWIVCLIKEDVSVYDTIQTFANQEGIGVFKPLYTATTRIRLDTEVNSNTIEKTGFQTAYDELKEAEKCLQRIWCLSVVDSQLAIKVLEQIKALNIVEYAELTHLPPLTSPDSTEYDSNLSFDLLAFLKRCERHRSGKWLNPFLTVSMASSNKWLEPFQSSTSG